MSAPQTLDELFLASSEPCSVPRVPWWAKCVPWRIEFLVRENREAWESRRRQWQAVVERMANDRGLFFRCRGYIKRYGYWDGLLAALECHEVHLPGDCPMCGAE